MSEIEKSLKEQLEMVIKDNQRLLEKHFKQDSELVKLTEEKEYYKSQLQQKENIIKEVREYIEKHIAMFKNGNMLVDINVDELLEILDKVGDEK